MKKFLFAILMLTIAVGTVYSSLQWKGSSSRMLVAGAATDPLAYMPDSDFIVLIDVGQFFSSKLYSTLTGDPKSSAQIKQFETDALKYGVDIHQLKQVVIGGRSISGSKQSNFYAVVTGSFDREKLLAGIASQPDKVSMQSETYNDKTIYILTEKGGKKPTGTDSESSQLGQLPLNYKTDKMGLAFLSSGMVALGSIDGVKTTLDVQTGKQPNLLTNQQLVNYISNINAGALIRFAGLEPDKARTESAKKAEPEAEAKPGQKKPKVITNEQLGDSKSKSSQGESSASHNNSGDPSGMGDFDKMLESVRGAYGSIDIATGFNLDTTLLIRTESDAKKMSQGLNGLVSLGKMMLSGEDQKDPKQAKLLEAINQVNVADAGKDVKITINLSEQLIRELFAVLEAEQKKPGAKAEAR